MPDHKLHTILFCSPLEFTKSGGLRITIDNRIYAGILKGPKVYSTRTSRAYIFGKKYPIDKYRFLGSHAGTGKTGFLDLDLLVNDPRVTQIVKRLYKPKYNWSDRRAFEQLHAHAPYFLFMGKTYDRGGGHPGLFAHYRYGKIDSLLIDDYHFFE